MIAAPNLAVRPIYACTSVPGNSAARSLIDSNFASTSYGYALDTGLMAVVDPRVEVQIRKQSAEDIARTAVQNRGQYLVRQGRWHELSEAIFEADKNRNHTPGGMPITDLLAFGARADVVQAVEMALISGRHRDPDINKKLNDNIDQLEQRLHKDQDNYAFALVLALAHLDIAWLWRGSGWEATLPQRNRIRVQQHLKRARDILTPFCGLELDSPAIASAHCAVLAGEHDPRRQIADSFEDLIDLDPGNNRHMRALGYYLLPNWFGSYGQLEHQARETQKRTADIWGKGAYTWVYFDALAQDEGACHRVDTDLFIDGLKDILTRRPEQSMVNLLAAYCATTLRLDLGADDLADMVRLQIVDCAHWLICGHLTEIHPLIWAHACEGFDNNAQITSIDRFAIQGELEARRAIAAQFSDDLDRGLKVTLTQNGPKLDPIQDHPT